jgi:peptidoglycan/xylan/chitin deacetylase (PgdA/CDA1 family)
MSAHSDKREAIQMSKLLGLALIFLLVFPSCTPVSNVKTISLQAQPTVIVATATVTPLPIPTVDPTSTPAPTDTPTITPTPDPIRSTPPTIMLHRSNENFDSVAFLRDLIAILKQNEMKVITYRDIQNDPSITATEKGKLFIITIDDIYLRYPMHSSVKEMIDLLQQAGYPAVLGVITESDYAYPETAALLKELSDAGWEIATHTNQHANLGEMEKTAPRYVFTEVSTSMDKIEKVTGVQPVTLILPEGQMVNDPRFIKRAGIYWVVGINGGTTYDSRKDLIYVGRESPFENAEKTFEIMRKRFGF